MKTINEQINPEFVNRANKLTKITQFLRPALPVECHNHVQVANIRQHILLLITDSPVWTTRLRQLSPQILQYIHENSLKFDACFIDARIINSDATKASHVKPNKKQTIHHIQVSTRYHTKYVNENRSSTNKSQHQPVISKKTAKLLAQSADSIKHPQLKSSLLKLAQNGSSSN